MREDNQEAGGPIVLGSMLLYAAASLWHFAHNAVYVDAYPNLPASLSAPRVWAAWAALSALGLFGYLLLRLGRPRQGLAVVALYGLFGFDGLSHYVLAPVSAHTVTMNLTIWGEAVAAAALVSVTARCMWKMRAEHRGSPA